jgi:hypothetical protein
MNGTLHDLPWPKGAHDEPKDIHEHAAIPD